MTAAADARCIPRALVTGSNDGIGAAVAHALVGEGYEVVRHARNRVRADDYLSDAPEGTQIAVGDFASLAETHDVARQAAALGPFDVVVHNAGTGAPPARELTADGIERTLQVNAVAPYLLTALMPPPERIVYVGSDSIRNTLLDLDDIQSGADWDQGAAYGRSKIALTALGLYVARHWPSRLVNVVHPGWVRSKMSGEAAPLSLEEGADTIVWLALARDPEALVSGELFFERAPARFNDQPHDPGIQEAVVAAFEQLTGVVLPKDPRPQPQR
ncbi:SDR family NAD(P)-dependent oxidoreductase [Jiangella aurantiaca]|uniref:SDR family NAD(P)-dependent oxidoreductase n=1 Tax=Jiangella aurantiaca TaxID=2530373 RepID=A0A4R5ALQ8_9ACTN|nr:SDR family NAD(P)-dependent oxidoreductase [Jiangella aurantiaca]TDD72570.1 SDR family NAD(P)-dependent oxidoreductase [Jiangella aurantiaca]